MILRRLRLHPFGCFSDREVRFEPGLNVVLGPNEAGKSTLFHAARTSLLRTSLDKRRFGEFIQHFLPAGGGDTVRVEIGFETTQGPFVLKRRWGVSPASELTLPDGTVMSDDEAVRVRLESILPARQGAFWRVLFTSQTELTAAVDSLEKDGPETLADLSDILRRSLLETGGVSPDRFRASLARKIDAAFDNWDVDRACPRGNRGIDNPWKKNVGEILEAHYERERLARELRRAREAEEKTDEANKHLRQTVDALAELRRFLDDNRKACDDARARKTLEATLQSARAGQEELTRGATDWPVARRDAERLAQTIRDLEGRRAPLRRERESAALEAERLTLRQRLERVTRLEEAWREARVALDAAPAVTRAQVEEIREAVKAADALSASPDGGKLELVLLARTGIRIRIGRDQEAPESLSLDAGERRIVAAGGRIRIEHPEMEIEVRSGDVDPQARRAEHDAAASRLQDLLAARGVRGLEEADERQRSRERLSTAAEAARRQLLAELGGESQEALHARGEELGPDVGGRPLAVVVEELARLETEAEARGRELGEVRRQLQKWETAYESPEKLIGKLADLKGREREVQGRIDALAPLPAGFPEADAFVEAYERSQRDHAELVARVGEVREAKARLEGAMPDQSAEELSAQLDQSTARFQTLLRTGEALIRVRRETERLLASSDASIFTGMKQELGRLMKVMTRDRYGDVAMEGSLPTGLVRRDGPELDWDLLSAGTRDILALGLRLVMASRFLGDARGFVMMDDPLVEMDPERQQASAAALRAFAEERQLVIFTCHPSHAELLGGNRITL